MAVKTQLGIFLGSGDDMIEGEFNGASTDGNIVVGGQVGVDRVEMSMSDEMEGRVLVRTVERELVYDNGVDDFGGVNYSVDGFFHTPNLNYRTADDLAIAESKTIREITWTGSYGGDLNTEFPDAYELDDFTIEIYEGNSEIAVGSPIASFNVGNDVNRTDTGGTIGPLGIKKVYAYSAEVDLTLEAEKRIGSRSMVKLTVTSGQLVLAVIS